MDKQESILYFKDIAALLNSLQTVTPRSNLFHIQKHEDVPATHLRQTQIFRSGTFSISVLTDGEAEYKIGMQDYLMKAGSFYFMSPQHLRYYKKIKPWRGYGIVFSDEFIHQYSTINIYNEYPFFQLDANVQIQLTKQQQDELCELAERIQQLYQSAVTDKFKLIYHYLSIVLLQAKKWYVEQNGDIKQIDKVASLAKLFSDLLEKHFFDIVTQKEKKIFSVADFANRLNVNAHYLSDVMKKETGKTPTQLIKERTILEAKALLRNTDLSVSQIAYFLTFEDPSYFAKYFKSATGVSPSDFKQNQ